MAVDEAMEALFMKPRKCAASFPASPILTSLTLWVSVSTVQGVQVSRSQDVGEGRGVE